MNEPTFGAHVDGELTRFAVHAASEPTLCLFGDDGRERRMAMTRRNEVWSAAAPAPPGSRYGYRTAADPATLLVDPYAVELDRPFPAALSMRGVDTDALMPRAIVQPIRDLPRPLATLFAPGGLVYELNVRGFTMVHPDVPEAQRGTIAALAHPSIVAHFRKLGVAAIELMPIVAWIDERHLPPLGLRNLWGYNPVVPMALDPHLAPGGVEELRATVATLRAEGIGVILDLVFNHTGESDADGPTLSLRGLDERYYAHAPDRALINDTGTGNTLDFGNPLVRRLTIDTLRHFAALGVDGFRFDLATVMARGPGFDPAAPIFAEIAADPALSTRIMIAEPWDVGPGGYQLGRFPAGWLEWNDRFRDDVRRFWRGDGAAGSLAMRLAGSSDLFPGRRTRSINFVAAHDGFTLADTVAYARKRNEANGEDNRDGTDDNHSWNEGVEGPSEDPAIRARRKTAVRAMLATLFASTGTIMLTAGDEFGRTQLGNNNAYAQDNAIGWIDWDARDAVLEDDVARLARWRAENGIGDALPSDVEWLTLDGSPMTPDLWAAAEGFVLRRGAATIRVDRPARTVGLS